MCTPTEVTGPSGRSANTTGSATRADHGMPDGASAIEFRAPGRLPVCRNPEPHVAEAALPDPTVTTAFGPAVAGRSGVSPGPRGPDRRIRLRWGRLAYLRGVGYDRLA